MVCMCFWWCWCSYYSLANSQWSWQLIHRFTIMFGFSLSLLHHIEAIEEAWRGTPFFWDGLRCTKDAYFRWNTCNYTTLLKINKSSAQIQHVVLDFFSEFVSGATRSWVGTHSGFMLWQWTHEVCPCTKVLPLESKLESGHLAVMIRWAVIAGNLCEVS